MSDDFYVGYLQLPGRLRKSLLILVPALLAGVIGSSIVLSASQDDPGSGTWQADRLVSLEGRITLQPYPMIVTKDGPILLVAEGKFGALRAVEGFDATSVVASGYVIQRDGQRMLELSGEAPLRSSEAQVPDLSVQTVGSARLQGQIIDPKCYLGVMRPGEGKVHKACAVRCIAGGIPPMFLVRNPDGSETFYLLTDPLNRPLREEILPFVADPIEVSGEVAKMGSQLILRIDPRNLRRL